jgi:outer membrane scaffolding protein for murein synthesis (MipA/OmpV family)
VKDAGLCVAWGGTEESRPAQGMTGLSAMQMKSPVVKNENQYRVSIGVSYMF